jgi:hypothetical protein
MSCPILLTDELCDILANKTGLERKTKREKKTKQKRNIKSRVLVSLIARVCVCVCVLYR